MRLTLSLLFQIIILLLAGLAFRPLAQAQEFVTPPFYPSVGLQPNYIATGDLNGDGKVDIVLSDYYSSEISVLINKGDGTFQRAVTYSIGQDISGAEDVQVGDFNGDGNLDIAVAADDTPFGTGGISVLLNNGDGTFQSAVYYSSDGQDARGVAIGDFNGDHKLDIMVTNITSSTAAGSIVVLWETGMGRFSPAS
jgi:hypothetical protein